MKIGLISDTHSFFHPRLPFHFKNCDEIWHAGDIGSMEVAENLQKIARLRAVHGNIDGGATRRLFQEDEIFTVDHLKVFLTHIGGYPGRYNARALEIIRKEKPGLFVCGHSHICKVQYDKDLEMLHINPGAAGKHGAHQVITVIRLEVISGVVSNLEVLEMKRNQDS
jgi:uncharacterized protein